MVWDFKPFYRHIPANAASAGGTGWLYPACPSGAEAVLRACMSAGSVDAVWVPCAQGGDTHRAGCGKADALRDPWRLKPSVPREGYSQRAFGYRALQEFRSAPVSPDEVTQTPPGLGLSRLWLPARVRPGTGLSVTPCSDTRWPVQHKATIR